MLVIKLAEMHEVSVTPLCDCTVLIRSTRREASALQAAIRKKRGFLSYRLEAFSSHAKQPHLRRKEA
jgi:hypothetical protein